MFHPHEIGFVGYSGAGKTTLIARLIERLRDRHLVGFVKHDAHHFVMDAPGKDTWIARQAGAHAVVIRDGSHMAWLGEARRGEEPTDLFAACDVVFVEGFKNGPTTKFVLIDPRDEARQLFSGALPGGIVGVIGPDTRPSYVPSDLPFYDRDDIDAICDAVERHLESRALTTPVKGLILAGGRSSRMGEDKAFIEYHGRPQLEWALEEAASVVGEVFVSLRHDQHGYQRIRGHQQLCDRFHDFGPMGAILTALHADRSAAWLVLACDMPFADRRSIAHLVKERSPLSIATAYASPGDGLPEPLFCIWEPESLHVLHAAVARDRLSPRRILSEARASLVQSPAPETVVNANNPDERVAAERLLSADTGRRSSV